LLASAGLYLAVMTFGGCADKLILYPSTRPVHAYSATRLRFDDTSGRQTLEVWTDRSPGARSRDPEAFVLEFIGNASRAEDVTSYVASRWGARPVEVWSLNYPGYGGSTGPATLHSIPPAALRAYEEMAKRAGNKPIIVSGNSLGTTAALYVASHRRVNGLIVQNPPPLRSMILRQFGWWNLWLLAGPVAMQVPGDLDSLRNAPRVTAPAVFVMSSDDEVVAPRFHKMVLDAYAGPTRVIDVAGGTHNSEIEGKAADELQAGMDWLLDSVRPSASE
jgi:hypothetical protein